MSTIQATQMQICIFTLHDKTYEDQPADEKAMFDAFARVVIEIQEKHGSTAPIDLNFCPLTMNENAVIVAKQGLDISRLPAAQVWATYPDGNNRLFFLKTGLGGIDFTPEVLRPYVESLLYNRAAQEQSLICKIIPPLCDLGGWVWLGLALGASYKSTQARNIGKIAWGIGAAALWQGWASRGGLDQVKEAVGIGKT